MDTAFSLRDFTWVASADEPTAGRNRRHGRSVTRPESDWAVTFWAFEVSDADLRYIMRKTRNVCVCRDTPLLLARVSSSLGKAIRGAADRFAEASLRQSNAGKSGNGGAI